MIAVTPQMRILVAIEPIDFRKGIDGISRVCRAILSEDPFDGTLFVFRSRAAKAIKLLAYDGQGFWLAQKRLSTSKFLYWPSPGVEAQARVLLAHQFNLLIWGGDPKAAQAAPMWRPLNAAPAEIQPS